MTSDDSYLRRRGGQWHLWVTVPSSLRPDGWPGVVERPLDTDDAGDARRRRDELLPRVKAAIRRAARRPITDHQITTAALRAGARTAAELSRRPALFAVDPETGHFPAGHQLASLRDALRSGNFAAVEPEVQQTLVNVAAKANTVQRLDLARAIAIAQAAAIEAAIETMDRARGGDDWRTPLPPGPDRDDPDVLTAAAALTAYEAHKRPRWAPRTRVTFHNLARLFLDHVADQRPLADIATADAQAFLARIAGLDPGYKRHYKAATPPLAELLARHPGRRSASNLRTNAAALRAAFAWFIGRGWHRGPNPFGSRKGF